MNEKQTIYISPRAVLLALAVLAAVGLVLVPRIPHGWVGSVGGGSAAQASGTGTWSSDACEKYKAQVFGDPNMSFVHGTEWYYDCTHTPVMQYPRAPGVLPDGHYMPTLPYKP